MTSKFFRTEMTSQVPLFGKMKLEQVGSQSLRMLVPFRAKLAFVLEKGGILLVNTLDVGFDVGNIEGLPAVGANSFRLFLPIGSHLGAERDFPLRRLQIPVDVLFQHFRQLERCLTKVAAKSFEGLGEMIVVYVPLEFLLRSRGDEALLNQQVDVHLRRVFRRRTVIAVGTLQRLFMFYTIVLYAFVLA